MYSIIGADGKEYGPVPADKVRDWLAAGRANAQTRIKPAGATEWTTVGALPEFSAPAAAPTLAPGMPAAAAVPEAMLASRWVRLGAAILDSIFSGIFLGPGFALLIISGALMDGQSDPNPALLLPGIGALAIGAIALIAIQVWLLTTRGQTLGKKLCSIKIVRHADHTNPGFVSAVLLRAVVNGLITGLPLLGGIYALVDILFIFRDDRRCIHDLIAGTIVVQA